LLDAELLAEVYIDLIGARQSQTDPGVRDPATSGAGGPGEMPAAGSVKRRSRRGFSEEDRLAHRAFVATLGDKPIWNDFLAA